MGLNVLAQLESMAVLMEVAAMMSPVGFWSHVLNFYEAPDGSKQLLIYAKQTKVHKSPAKLFFIYLVQMKGVWNEAISIFTVKTIQLFSFFLCAPL